MFKEFQKLFGNKREVFDVRTLEDPIALKTSWDPLVSGGWNLCTHRLSSVNGRRKMQVSLIAHCFCFFCIGFGVCVSRLVVWNLDDPPLLTGLCRLMLT